jgi:hypothetical protein
MTKITAEKHANRKPGLLVAMPFVMAFVLNVLAIAAVHFGWNRERISGYGFLFATPWAWLVDSIWFRNIHSGWLAAPSIYAAVLWIPAALYSGCLFLNFVILRKIAARSR